jgi:teichuronic acid biosynthesis glycosyltransferase TuaC
MHRLAVITSYFPIREQPHRGHSAYQTLQRLKKRMEIRVFCPLAVYPRWLRPRNFPYLRADNDYSPAEIRAQYVEFPALPVLSRPFNGLVCQRRLSRQVERFRPDVILNYCLYPEGYAAVLLGKKLGVPVVLGAIGSDVNRIPDWPTRWLTQKALREASFVLAVSEHLRLEAIRLGASAERTRTVRNGCDTSIFHLADRLAARAELGLDPGSSIIAFVGWLSPTKGLRELVDAVIRLVASHPKLLLVCIGEGHLRDELEARVARAGVARNVGFPGRCSSPQVAHWLVASDVFCLPSYAEGSPNALIEALSCGRPAVATAVGGIPELVNADNGILVPPRDSEALAEALRRTLARQWDEAGIARAFTRGWDRVADDTYEMCMDALGTVSRKPSDSNYQVRASQDTVRPASYSPETK